MKTASSLKRGLTKVWKLQDDRRYDLALKEVDSLLEDWPGNAQLLVLRAELIQLQEDEEGSPSLEDAKNDLKRALALDELSPNTLIEMGYFLFKVEDDAKAASKYFQRAIKQSREFLREALLGQAELLSEQDQKEEALACLLEAYQLRTQNGHLIERDLLERLKALQ